MVEDGWLEFWGLGSPLTYAAAECCSFWPFSCSIGNACSGDQRGLQTPHYLPNAWHYMSIERSKRQICEKSAWKPFISKTASKGGEKAWSWNLTGTSRLARVSLLPLPNPGVPEKDFFRNGTVPSVRDRWRPERARKLLGWCTETAENWVHECMSVGIAWKPTLWDVRFPCPGSSYSYKYSYVGGKSTVAERGWQTLACLPWDSITIFRPLVEDPWEAFFSYVLFDVWLEPSPCNSLDETFFSIRLWHSNWDTNFQVCVCVCC